MMSNILSGIHWQNLQYATQNYLHYSTVKTAVSTNNEKKDGFYWIPLTRFSNHIVYRNHKVWEPFEAMLCWNKCWIFMWECRWERGKEVHNLWRPWICFLLGQFPSHPAGLASCVFSFASHSSQVSLLVVTRWVFLLLFLVFCNFANLSVNTDIFINCLLIISGCFFFFHPLIVTWIFLMQAFVTWLVDVFWVPE